MGCEKGAELVDLPRVQNSSTQRECFPDEAGSGVVKDSTANIMQNYSFIRWRSGSDSDHDDTDKH